MQSPVKWVYGDFIEIYGKKYHFLSGLWCCVNERWMSIIRKRKSIYFYMEVDIVEFWIHLKLDKYTRTQMNKKGKTMKQIHAVNLLRWKQMLSQHPFNINSMFILVDFILWIHLCINLCIKCPCLRHWPLTASHNGSWWAMNTYRFKFEPSLICMDKNKYLMGCSSLFVFRFSHFCFVFRCWFGDRGIKTLVIIGFPSRRPCNLFNYSIDYHASFSTITVL